MAAAAGGRFVVFHYISAVRLDARPCRVNCKQKRPLQASIAPAADWMSKLLLTKKTSEQSELCSDVVRREGFEPPAFWSVARRSIQLSYTYFLNTFVFSAGNGNRTRMGV